MNWAEFTNKLTIAKKRGVNNGLSVGCMANLIFAGAFDDMLPEQPKPGQRYATYISMYEEVRNALKSKAMLPKKNKNIPVGLADVKNDMQLGLWRFLVNPMSKFDFIPYCKDALKVRGFKELDRFQKELGWDKHFPLKHDGAEDKDGRVKVQPTYLVREWNDIFDGNFQHAQQVTKFFISGARDACMVGVVTNTRKMAYGDNKTRMVVDFYNGSEVIKGLVIWPLRSSGDLPLYTRTMQKMSFGLLSFSPKMWKNRNTGTIIGWSKFID